MFSTTLYIKLEPGQTPKGEVEKNYLVWPGALETLSLGKKGWVFCNYIIIVKLDHLQTTILPKR